MQIASAVFPSEKSSSLKTDIDIFTPSIERLNSSNMQLTLTYLSYSLYAKQIMHNTYLSKISRNGTRDFDFS